MGKSTINLAIFNSYVKLPEGRPLEASAEKWPFQLERMLDMIPLCVWAQYTALLKGMRLQALN